MSSADRPAGPSDASPRRPWATFQAELMTTAAQAGWGLWGLCVLLLAALAVTLVVSAARDIL